MATSVSCVSSDTVDLTLRQNLGSQYHHATTRSSGGPRSMCGLGFNIRHRNLTRNNWSRSSANRTWTNLWILWIKSSVLKWSDTDNEKPTGGSFFTSSLRKFNWFRSYWWSNHLVYENRQSLALVQPLSIILEDFHFFTHIRKSTEFLHTLKCNPLLCIPEACAANHSMPGSLFLK